MGDRGLNWLYAYNHQEAADCFTKAIELDPTCAMAHWGVSYAAGPIYNLPWHRYDPAGKANALATAYDAMQQALSHVDGVPMTVTGKPQKFKMRYVMAEELGAGQAASIRAVATASPLEG